MVLTAQKLQMRMLVIHTTGHRSKGNMQKLAKFLGKQVSPNAKYPHVHTPSKHLGEKEPPANEPDPNEDLWQGNWNGHVPKGHFSSTIDEQSLRNFSSWVAQLADRF